MTQRNETKIRNETTKRIAPDTRVPGSDGQIAAARGACAPMTRPKPPRHCDESCGDGPYGHPG